MVGWTLRLLFVLTVTYVSSAFTISSSRLTPGYALAAHHNDVLLAPSKKQTAPVVGEIDVVNNEDIEEANDYFKLGADYVTTKTSTKTKTVITEVAIAENNVSVEEESWLEYVGWRSVVVVCCVLWASNFAAAKVVMAEPGVDSSLYALVRFGIAALALAPGSVAAIKRGAIDMETAKSAAICGGWVAFGYLGQTLGLLTTTASKSCVICSLHCIFVAIVAEWTRVSGFFQEEGMQGIASKFNLMRLIPAAVAVAGVAIIELHGAAGPPTIGDALSFAQPIGFGLGYLQLEEMMKKRPEAALPVSAIKLVVVALASLAMFELSPLISLVDGSSAATVVATATTEAAATTTAVGVSDTITQAVQGLWPLRTPDLGAIVSSPVALGGILYTGLVTTSFALWIESIAFKRVPATDASIILTTEPLFAAAAGAYALGETFGLSDYVGAALIVGACVLSVLVDNKPEENQVVTDITSGAP